MLVERLLTFVKIVLLLLVVITEGGSGGKKKKKGRKDTLADEPTQVTPQTNICEIPQPVIIYCYCNDIEYNKATETNCWIFNDTSDEEHANLWEIFTSQTRVRTFTLHLRPDGTLKRIPTAAILHLPEINIFEVQYAEIHTVHSFAFANSSTIDIIKMARNSISVLEPHAFAHLRNLSSISLGENHITELNRTVFTNLPKLKQLYIDRNNITSIEDNAFQELKHLEELELYSNQIQVVVPETFKGLVSLNLLDLHKNRIEVIGDNTFQDLRSLNTLNLKSNNIKFIAPNSFSGLKKLRRLNLQDNKLLSLGPKVFVPISNLFFLDLRQNVLETLTNDTIDPIMKRLHQSQMEFFIKGNNLRCDTRLLWMFKVYNTTKSSNVRSSLGELYCYLEMGSLPERLELNPLSTPLYEVTTTLGIGPRTVLLQLLPDELPDPFARTPATFTEQTEPKEKIKQKHKGEKRKNRNKHKKKQALTTITPEKDAKSNPQNDMAPLNRQNEGKMLEKVKNPQPEPRSPITEMRPAAPVQESRTFEEENASNRVSPGIIISLNTFSLLIFRYYFLL